ncbi:MAG: metallophosphoesterase family protein [Bacilli bacterium]|jgi:protein phosphatase|nr:metallophosphoesterase family protein [Bacilli bacterium]MCX4254947.1 metallophosphoesterase family protein [Bacilli bacterium]
MDKIAIIADIHGNLEALNTVLEDIKKRGIRRIFCLGDIIGKGSNSHECIKLVKENCEVVIQGNNDIVFLEDNYSSQNIDYLKRRKWNQSLLTNEDKEYLKSLPFCFEFYMSGSLIRIFHATPDSMCGFCAPYDNLNVKYNMFLPTNNTITSKKADVVIFGHTHTNYVERKYNRTLINVGSLGNSLDLFRNDQKDANLMETTRAEYLILEGEYNSQEYISSFSYQFINIPYNIDKELQNQKDNVELENYILELKEGRYRDLTRAYNDFKNKGIDIDNI